jgi:hypothetical protein
LQDLLLIPVTSRSSLFTDSEGGTSTSSSGSKGTKSSALLAPLLSALYDGDTVLLDEVELIVVENGQELDLYAAVLLQVRTDGYGCVSAVRILKGSTEFECGWEIKRMDVRVHVL